MSGVLKGDLADIIGVGKNEERKTVTDGLIGGSLSRVVGDFGLH